MKFKTKFRLITWTLRINQLSFLIFAIYAWLCFRDGFDFMNLFLVVFFLACSFTSYYLQVLYRREFGEKLRAAFINDPTYKQLNRKGRRKLKKLNNKMFGKK